MEYFLNILLLRDQKDKLFLLKENVNSTDDIHKELP